MGVFGWFCCCEKGGGGGFLFLGLGAGFGVGVGIVGELGLRLGLRLVWLLCFSWVSRIYFGFGGGEVGRWGGRVV